MTWPLVLVGALLTFEAPADARPPQAGARQAPATQDAPAKAPGDGTALALQVMLDRAGFSPGVIDGLMGSNTRRALALYEQHRGQPAPAAERALATYTITGEDAAGPFVPEIPSDLVEQADLPALAYTSVLEAIAERFHSTPALLQRLNPGARFTAGEEIQVPDVEPLAPPVTRRASGTESGAEERGAPGNEKPTGTTGRGAPADGADAITARPDVVVTVSRTESALTVADASGRLLFYAPVTTGSERDPLPIGEWKVNGVQFNPVFHYNPDLFWDADPSHSKAKIPPGPNNPVGFVWIDLDKEHYGIHGTPEPEAIGRAQSHGCVRLTNWDALKLAAMVKPGTRVVFTE